jgi:tRNA threonylcarbamoyladenosine biosynthesis protein TsaE
MAAGCGAYPLADLAIYIEATDETDRKVTLLAYTPLGRSLLQGMNA